MGKVLYHSAVSLDGFVAGPNDSPENGLGDGGDALFKWYFDGDTEIQVSSGTPLLKVSPQSAEFLEQASGGMGAGVWGRKTFDIAQGWGGHPPVSPAFIVTHSVPQKWAKPGSLFTFVTGGVESAIRQAKRAAGDNDVVVSTASILQQGLKLGLVDEINLSVVPVLLGGGVRLFDHLGPQPIELERVRVIEAPGVTHMTFRVRRDGPSRRPLLPQTD